MEFEDKHPAKGSGAKRGHTGESTAGIVNKHTQKTGVKKGLKTVQMFEALWMKIRVQDQLYPKAEAAAEWERVKASVAEKDTDMLGPSYDRYRQPMPVEEYVDLYKDTSQEKSCVVADAKKRKLTGAEQLAELQSEVSAGHASHSNVMFQHVGGGIANVLTNAGLTHGGLSSNLPPEKSVFAQQLDAAKLAKETADKKRHAYQEENRGR